MKGSIKALEHIRLLNKVANDFEDFELNSFDTVILNSVIQYFPSITYLLEVLEGALDVLSPDGCIFVGDVRSLPMLRAYHTSVQLQQAPGELALSELHEKVTEHVSREEELVIDPAFFFALKEKFSVISHIEVMHKRGQYHNELTRFRYDVIIHLGADRNENKDVKQFDWEKNGLSLDRIRELLELEAPEVLEIIQAPNDRVYAEMQALETIESGSEYETVEQLRGQV
ncbi:MAG: hypothetical protein GY852_01305, partial [bacterium]|nr:hypothetical protein [bacterium]